MRKTLAITLCALTVLVSGCGNDAKEPNAENFTLAINHHLEKRGCASLGVTGPRVHSINNDGHFPVRFTPGLLIKSDNTLDALVEAGVLTVKHHTVEQNGHMTTSYRDYELTELGKKSLNPKNPLQFCLYDFRVDKIVNWSEPTQLGGKTVTEVNFVTKSHNLQEWATHPAIVKYFNNLYKQFRATRDQTYNPKAAQEGRRVLVLTNTGWSAEN